jgi:hypothetical protein
VSKQAPSLSDAGLWQTEQTQRVFLGAQDCLDGAGLCPSMWLWGLTGPLAAARADDWRQGHEDDRVVKPPELGVTSDRVAASSPAADGVIGGT